MFKKVKTEHILLSVILFLGFFVRIYKINNPIADWHSWRQSDTASVSKIFIERGIDVLYPRYHDISSIQTGIFNPEGYRMVEFPIYNATIALLVKSFPLFSLEIWSRLITIFASLITALFLYLLGKKYLSSKVGIWASFFYLFLPFNIYFTRVILPDPLGVTFAVAALYFFDSRKILSAVLFSLALLIKPYFIFYLVAFIPNFFEKNNFRHFLLYIFISCIPLVFWRVWISQFPEGIPFYEWAFNGDRIRFHFAFFRWIFWERLTVLILGIFGLIPFLTSFAKNNRNKFTINFLLGMFLYVSVVATANVRHDYYQILVIPAVSLALAQGINWLWNKNKLTLLIIPLTYSHSFTLFPHISLIILKFFYLVL